MATLEVKHVVCVRGDRPLFQPVSFTLAPGALIHIQGPNGRGKTTLMRAIAGLSWAAEGEILWAGQQILRLREDYRQEVAYIGHLNGVQGDLTPVENLRFFGALQGLSRAQARERAEAALITLGIAGSGDLPAKFLSQGQRRRLALARLLVGNQKLWLLDEPFAALDVRSVEELAHLIGHHLAAGGQAVLISHQEVPIAGDRQALSLLPPKRVS
ncbi:MAG: cytochrome c biogenesis heme-transporting ATPase CcmA [Acidiferrobacteraceae bacterium]